MASRISACSAGADIGERVVREETTLLAVALGHAIDAALAELEDASGAVHVLALGRREERRIQLRGERVAFDADLRLDGEPHGAVGRSHERGAIDDAARPLELRLVRELQRAFAAFHL